jgi:hypothetical protein
LAQKLQQIKRGVEIPHTYFTLFYNHMVTGIMAFAAFAAAFYVFEKDNKAKYL